MKIDPSDCVTVEVTITGTMQVPVKYYKPEWTPEDFDEVRLTSMIETEFDSGILDIIDTCNDMSVKVEVKQ